MQGRHVKTGQLAAIKVMDVTEVSGRRSAGTFFAGSSGRSSQGLDVWRAEVLLAVFSPSEAHSATTFRVCGQTPHGTVSQLGSHGPCGSREVAQHLSFFAFCTGCQVLVFFLANCQHVFTDILHTLSKNRCQ